MAAILNRLSWSAEKGARNFLYATTQNTSPGSYISACAEVPVSTFVASELGRQTQVKYWKECRGVWKAAGAGEEVDQVMRV